MNLYMAQIDLKDGSKALSFAHAVDQWMSYLKEKGAIRDWKVMRRKLDLASDLNRDFLIQVEVEDLAQLDRAFRTVGALDDDAERLYAAVNQMVETKSFGLYRPFPDPERAERMALF